MIRRRLQAGFGRTLGTALVSLGVFLAVYSNWEQMEAAAVKPLEAAPKIAFVAAAFSVTAYNLRTRVMDLVLKIEGHPTRVAELCLIARNCGKRLTNLVLFFTLTAVALGGMGFLSSTMAAARPAGSTVMALFAGSCVHFIYILFAFERLERFMLEDSEVRAQKKEAERLLADQPQQV